MSRLAVFAVLAALVAVALANPPPQGGAAHQRGHPVRNWFHNEKVKIEGAWKKNVVPQIQAMEKKFGAEWQAKAPVVAKAIKAKAGTYFNEALAYVKQQIASKLSSGGNNQHH